jgi:hypothetical protein
MFKAWSKPKERTVIPAVETVRAVDESVLLRLEKRVKQVEDHLTELEYNHRGLVQSFEAVTKQFTEMAESLKASTRFETEAWSADRAERDKDMLSFIDKMSDALNDFRGQIADPF